MSEQLDRNIGITVTALNYLLNIHNELNALTVINQEKLNKIKEIAIRDGLTSLFDVSTYRAKMETV